MNEGTEKDINEIFSQAKPYLNSPSEIESEIEEISKKSSSIKETREKIEGLISDEKDPSKRTDYRILMNKLREE